MVSFHPLFNVMIGSHPTKNTHILKWMFQVPGPSVFCTIPVSYNPHFGPVSIDLKIRKLQHEGRTCTLPKTNIALKINGWKMKCPLR